MCECFLECGVYNKTPAHRHISIEVHRVILNVAGDEVVVGHGQEGHLWQGEDIHELLHIWALCGWEELQMNTNKVLTY